MRKAWVRVEQRLDESIAVRFQDHYVRVQPCPKPIRGLQAKAAAAQPLKKTNPSKRQTDWMNSFSLQSGPSLRQAVKISNARS